MYSEECGRIGRRLFSEGLISGNFGNMSVRGDGGFFITSSGSFLDEPGELIFVPDTGSVPVQASSEYRVHFETYLRTSYQALVHAHPPFAIAASFCLRDIFPKDCEGKMFCSKIPVIDGPAGSEKHAREVAEALSNVPIVIARGHGTFAAGKTIEEAYLLTSIAEHACRILYYSGEFGGRSL
jgi:L-fuculose-phosphate aldolase